MKKIALIGAGNGAQTMAADLASRGYEVNMYEQSAFIGKLGWLQESKTIRVTGVLNVTAKIAMLTDNLAEAIKDVTYILVVTPSFAHETIAEQLKGIIRKDQVLVLYPGAFAALVFKKILGDECPVIAEANNLPYDTRLKGEGLAFCSGINPINMAFFPADAKDKYYDDINDFIPIQYTYRDVLECGLSLVNPALHSGACVINIGMIEQQSRGGFHMYEHFTAGAAKLDVALDRERKEIGKALGYDLRPIEDFAGKPAGHQINWKELYMQMHGDVALTAISGPNDIWNRYLTEDCPNGLVPWVALGELCGVEAPTMRAIITIYSHIHERDWWQVGRKLDRLGLDGMTKEQVLEFVKTGKK